MATTYHDLNVLVDEYHQTSFEPRLQTLANLGFNIAVLNRTATSRLTESDRCSLKSIRAEHGSTSGLVLESCTSKMARRTRCCNVLSRITITIEDLVQAQSLSANRSLLDTYDLVAVTPTTERTFQQACLSLSVDIIALDLSKKLAFKLKPAWLHVAVKRGVVFEVTYAPALREPSARRHVFSNAMGLVRQLRGKGVILSSGSRDRHELRSTHELVHMAIIFGLTREQAQAALGSTCNGIINRAAARKLPLAGAFTITASPPVSLGMEVEAPGVNREGSQKRPRET